MRLKAEIWVKAYIRRCASQGAPAVVARHGDDDAGAIYIKILRADGLCALFGPAPAGLDGADFDRRWVALTKGGFAAEEDVQRQLEKEMKIDSDLWLVEVEDREGRDFLGDDLFRENS